MKKKNILIVLSLLLMVSILSGISYANWIFTNIQDDENEINVTCFQLTYGGEDTINLTNAVPLTDEVGSTLVPYTFTIKNVCPVAAYYDINIESTPTSEIDSSYIKVILDDNEPIKLADVALNDNKVLPDSIDSRKIGYGELLKDEQLSYNLKMYLDEDTPLEASESKKFRAKVTISYYQSKYNHSISLNTNGGSLKQNRYLTKVGSKLSNLPIPKKAEYEFNAWYSDQELTNKVDENTIVTEELTNLYAKYFEYDNVNTSTLVSGSIINKKMKELSGDNNVDDYLKENTNIHYIKRSFDLKNTDNIISTDDSNNLVYMWYENNTIYYYTNSKIINLNEDSSGLFAYLNGLKEIDLSGFNFSSATNIADMFMYDTSLTKLNLSSIDTSNVTNMSRLFSGLTLNSLDLSYLNTSKVTNMSGMFANCQNITSLDVSSFDTSKVENMSNMFNNMINLISINVSGLNTINVTDMGGIFSELHEIKTIDISSWNTYSLANINNNAGMFENCTKLEKIYVGQGWSTKRVVSSKSMFAGDFNLVGEYGTSYDSTKIDKTYAHVDEGPSNPGYFTFRMN